MSRPIRSKLAPLSNPVNTGTEQMIRVNSGRFYPQRGSRRVHQPWGRMQTMGNLLQAGGGVLLSVGLVILWAWPSPAAEKLQPLLSVTESRSRQLLPDELSFSPHLGSARDHLPQIRTVEDTYLLLNLSERTLYLYHRDTELKSYPVAVGREGWETPTGRFAIFQMQQNPVWEHPFTGEHIPPGANNPLGQRWLGFWSDGTNSIGFHGTPDEESIGHAISHGCVRLYNQDIIELYEHVDVGTLVHVVP